MVRLYQAGTVMMMVMEIWFFVIAFLAEVVGTIAGFGSSMILLPVALLVFDFKTALVLVAFVHFFGNAAETLFLRRRVNWRIWRQFSGVGILAAVAGALLTVRLDPALLQALLGGFLVAYGIFALCMPRFRLRKRPATVAVGATTSGFMAGLLGTGGALRSAFLSAFGLVKERYVATAAAIAVVVDGVRLPVYIHDGLLGSKYYWMVPVLLVIAVAGAYVGRRLVRKIPQRAFGKVVLVCLIAAGCKFLFDYF